MGETLLEFNDTDERMPPRGTDIGEVISRLVDFQYFFHRSDIQVRNYANNVIFPTSGKDCSVDFGFHYPIIGISFTNHLCNFAFTGICRSQVAPHSAKIER